MPRPKKYQNPSQPIFKFKVTHREKGESYHVGAFTRERALITLGWDEKDCDVEELGEIKQEA